MESGQEEEADTSDTEIFVQTLIKPYTLTSASSNTFETENRMELGTDTDARKSSAIFAINLDKFDSHSASFDAGLLPKV